MVNSGDPVQDPKCQNAHGKALLPGFRHWLDTESLPFLRTPGRGSGHSSRKSHGSLETAIGRRFSTRYISRQG
jgi:hypothetical protein